MREGGDDEVWVCVASVCNDARKRRRSDAVGVGDCYGVCTSECASWFAKPALGKKMVGEGVASGIDEDKVEAAGDLAVLEAVVEDDGTDFEAHGRGEEIEEAFEAVWLRDDWNVEREGLKGAASFVGFVGEAFAGGVATHGDYG